MEMPRTGLHRPSRAPWIVLAVVVLAGGVGLFLWLRQRSAAPVVATPPAAAADAGAEGASAGPAPTVEPGRVRSVLEAISSNALVRQGLAEGDVLRRWAVVTDNLSEGVSPRGQLAFLAPSKPFSVVTQGAKTLVDPASYRRYDAFADAVGSVDAQAAAKAYRELRAVVEGVYRALGYPNASLDAVTARALQRIASAPVKEGDVEVIGQRGFYAFADPHLEGLGQVEKHLLRMGPRNTRILQAKASELQRALGLPAPMSAGTGGKRP